MANRDITTLTGTALPTSILTRQDGDGRYLTILGGFPDGNKGDISIAGGVWSLNAAAVSLSKLAQIGASTILGNATAGTATPAALTGTQVTSLLDPFSTSLKGLAPASGGGTANYLRADGTWAAPAGSGGTSTANIAVVDLFANIATLHPAAPVKFIMTTGRTTVGQYGAIYVKDPDQTQYTTTGSAFISAAASATAAQTDVLAILNRIRIQDGDGTYWVIDDDRQLVHAGHFGAIPDANYAYANGAMTGTDSSAAIQALIDWRTYLVRYTPSMCNPCIIPSGTFLLSKGLQLSYGNTFVDIILKGVRMSVAGGMNGSDGTILICNFSDHPAISIQGGRNTPS